MLSRPRELPPQSTQHFTIWMF